VPWLYFWGNTSCIQSIIQLPNYDVQCSNLVGSVSTHYGIVMEWEEGENNISCSAAHLSEREHSAREHSAREWVRAQRAWVRAQRAWTSESATRTSNLERLKAQVCQRAATVSECERNKWKQHAWAGDSLSLALIHCSTALPRMHVSDSNWRRERVRSAHERARAQRTWASECVRASKRERERMRARARARTNERARASDSAT